MILSEEVNAIFYRGKRVSIALPDVTDLRIALYDRGSKKNL